MTGAGLMYRRATTGPRGGSRLRCRFRPAPSPRMLVDCFAPTGQRARRPAADGAASPAWPGFRPPGRGPTPIRRQRLRRRRRSRARPHRRGRARSDRARAPGAGARQPGRSGGAGRACAAGLDAHRTCAELVYLHAVLLSQAGNHAEAADALRRALYLDRRLIVAHLALGDVLTRLGEAAGARRAFPAAEQLLGELVPPPTRSPLPMASRPRTWPRWRARRSACWMARPRDGASSGKDRARDRLGRSQAEGRRRGRGGGRRRADLARRGARGARGPRPGARPPRGRGGSGRCAADHHLPRRAGAVRRGASARARDHPDGGRRAAAQRRALDRRPHRMARRAGAGGGPARLARRGDRRRGRSGRRSSSWAPTGRSWACWPTRRVSFARWWRPNCGRRRRESRGGSSFAP